MRLTAIGVRAGGTRGAAAAAPQPPPQKKMGATQIFGAAREIWAKPVFKDVQAFF